MAVWLNSREEFEEYTAGVLELYRGAVEPLILERRKAAGYCRACGCVRQFTLPVAAAGEWSNLLEGMVCQCGLNGRMRLGLKIVDDVMSRRAFPNSVVLERLTPLFPHLATRLPRLVGCEYMGDVEPGTHCQVNGIDVRHETLDALSFADASQDLILHFDVIEHVADAGAAFREIYRTLRPHGMMVFTCPFYHDLGKNTVRAEIRNGKIHHYLPEAYHGNPLSSQGSFVFIHPSWELLEMIYAAGFRKVQTPIAYSVGEGIFSNGCPFPDGHMWPMAIVATK
jgi:SAM-dependent methyltransferase